MDQDDAPKVAEPAVTVERDGHVLLMGLNRPAKRNAFGVQLLAELGAAYRLLESDDDLSCGVLFAHGDHFTRRARPRRGRPSALQRRATVPRGCAAVAVDAVHRWVLHAGDAFYHPGTVDGRTHVPASWCVVETTFAMDPIAVRRNHARLAELHQRHDPELLIVSAHSPELLDQAQRTA